MTVATTNAVPRPRRRWLRRIVIALLLLPIIAAAGIGLAFHLAEKDWRDALAETDALDPGWTFAELEAKRAVISDEQNSARRVLAAHAQLPEPWPSWPDRPLHVIDLDKSITELEPNAPLMAERSRRDSGHFPEALADLVPAYLGAVPTDPYNQQPLRSRKLGDGVVIYAVGSDLEDNQGEINRQSPGGQHSDLGVRLWASR